MTKKELKAITLADDLVEFLGDHPGVLASVHSVYPHAANLLIAENELITLTSEDDVTPMGLTLELGVGFSDLLKAGDQVVLNLDRFTSANGVLQIRLQGAEIWKTRSTARVTPRPAEAVAQSRLKLIAWLGQQPPLGLLPLLPRLTHTAMSSKPMVDNIYSRNIADDLESFTNAVNSSGWETALTLADRLIGFGMGSTPSCDDFLAAYLIVFSIAQRLYQPCYPWIREFNQSIASKAKNRTTLISANMLMHAADGKISRGHQRLIQTCLFEKQGDLRKLANEVIHHGATSGGDFLLGLVCALEWVQNTIIDMEQKGEQAWVELNQPQPVPGI